MPFKSLFRNVVGAVRRTSSRAASADADLHGDNFVVDMGHDDMLDSVVGHSEAKTGTANDEATNIGETDLRDWEMVEEASDVDSRDNMAELTESADDDWVALEKPIDFESCGEKFELMADPRDTQVHWEEVQKLRFCDEASCDELQAEAAESCRRAEEDGIDRMAREMWADICDAVEPRYLESRSWVKAKLAHCLHFCLLLCSLALRSAFASRLLAKMISASSAAELSWCHAFELN